MKESRVIQRSEWLYELEIPLRNDMMPGMIILKDYKGRYTLRVEMLSKKFPDAYLYRDEFKKKGAEQHVYLDRKTHEKWLKRFMKEEDRQNPTPVSSPKYFGNSCQHECTDPLMTNKFPNLIHGDPTLHHPVDAPVKSNLGTCVEARTSLGPVPSEPVDTSDVPHRQGGFKVVSEEPQSVDQEVVAISDDSIGQPDAVVQPDIVGGSGEDGAMELFSRETMLQWTFKRLGNRRSRVVKMLSKARKAGREHQIRLCHEQLNLIDSVQRQNKYGRYSGKTPSQQASDDEKTKGKLPPLRRPVIAGKTAATTVSNKLPLLPLRRDLSKPPVLPKRKFIFRSQSSDSFDLFESETEFSKRKTILDMPASDNVFVHSVPEKSNIKNKCTKSQIKSNIKSNVQSKIKIKPKNESKSKSKPVNDSKTNVKPKIKNVRQKTVVKRSSQPKIFKNFKPKSNVNKSNASHSKSDFALQNTFVAKVINAKSSHVYKSFNIRKTQPVARSELHSAHSCVQETSDLDTEPMRDDWTDESPEFSSGSAEDPKLYLGGKFSDQTSPDSPNTAAKINSKALWYAPCTRREYVYKMRAWKAEGRAGRPTNSPIGFYLPPSRHARKKPRMGD